MTPTFYSNQLISIVFYFDAGQCMLNDLRTTTTEEMRQKEIKKAVFTNMALFLLLLCIFTFISRLHGSEDIKQGSNILTVLPVATAGQIVRRVDDSLNLTCSVSGNSAHMSQFKITWQTPYSSRNSKSRVFSTQEHNKLTLVIQNLLEIDSGEYKCQAVDNNQTSLQEVVRVSVKRKKTACPDNFFHCGPIGRCIAKRYVCDGVQDCTEGTDEAPMHCGQDACEGKLRCENGRCIPYEWCCDDYVDPNCTAMVRLPCCRKLITGDMDADVYPPSEQQRFNDMGFLQTTIYTVIGCAMAFMFIVTVLVIAICRVHMKRTMLSRCPGAMLASRTGPGSSFPPHLGSSRLLNLPRATVPPLYDLDVFLSRSAELSQPSHSGLLVTYNINNGVQFVGRPVDPPPYSEVVTTPPREGPPPPYTSRENLAQTSTDQEECEENSSEGDRLLGNSQLNQSPVIRPSNGTIHVTVENSGESDSLLPTCSSSVMMPNYITSVQVAVVNPLPLPLKSNEGANEIDSFSSGTPDLSGSNSSSSDLSDHQSSSPSDSSSGQTLQYDTSPSREECVADSSSNSLNNGNSSDEQSNANLLCNNCSSNSSFDPDCIETDTLAKVKQIDNCNEAFNSNISRPVDASHSVTSSPSTYKISSKEEGVSGSLSSPQESGLFDCESRRVNGVADSSKPKVLNSGDT